MYSYGSGIPPGGSPPFVTSPGTIPPVGNPPGSNLSSVFPDYSDSGFRKTITFLQSPPVGASFIALTLFLLIVFISNVLFTSATLSTIGIIVTLSVLGFIALVLLISFFL